MYGCYYVTIGEQVFGVMSGIPLFVGTVMTILTLITSEVLFFFYGWYLVGLKWVIWCIQSYVLLDKPIPVCPDEHMLVFPSMIIVITSSVATFIMCYVVFWKARMGFIASILWWCTLLIPPAYLYVYGMNEWWQVLLSFVIGVVPTIVYAWFLKHHTESCVPILLDAFPLWHLGYRNTLMKSSEKEKY